MEKKDAIEDKKGRNALFWKVGNARRERLQMTVVELEVTVVELEVTVVEL